MDKVVWFWGLLNLTFIPLGTLLAVGSDLKGWKKIYTFLIVVGLINILYVVALIIMFIGTWYFSLE